jgi:hypothetical protein
MTPAATLATGSNREYSVCSVFTFRAAVAPQRRQLVAGLLFALVTVAACVLIGRRLTHSSWPLAHAHAALVALAACCYLGSYVLRARGWQRLFPVDQQPDQARCLASVGAAAASGAVLPFRLDYVVKVGTLRRLGGVRIGLEAIAFSIISLGIIDAVAMLPLSISATATSGSSLRGPLLIVVVFGIGCCVLLVASPWVARLPLLRRSRHLQSAANHIENHRSRRGRRNALIAAAYLFSCWTVRAIGTAVLLTALGLSFSPTTALCVLCLCAATGVVPITAGGAVANAGAAATILLVLGSGKDLAINFSLASGLLLVMSATVASLAGFTLSLTSGAIARRRPMITQA